MANTWQPTIRAGRCDVRSAWRSRYAPQFPLGCYHAAEVKGPKAIMTMTPNRRDAAPQKLRGQGDRDHDSRTDGTPHIRDVRDFPFLCRRSPWATTTQRKSRGPRQS
jgi:hypothetical protein